MMNTTSLDQAITAYHDSSRPITPPLMNSSPFPLNTNTPNNNNNNHRPHSRSKQNDSQRNSKVMRTADCGDEALGVRETPDCRGLACEGERLIRNGEFDESIPLLEQGLLMSLLLENADFNLVSVLWSLLGNAHYSLENHDLAAQCHIHDFALCRSRSDLLGMAQALCNLGNAYFKKGKFTRACHCYLVYLHTVQSMGDQRSIAKAYHNLGDLFQTIGFLLTRSSSYYSIQENYQHYQVVK
ncbi:G-protein-signaling modulator 1-like [Oopsacas minuta]|uniref:G-protein-signaling modulator 1-like n=1 Tax=Oopsacas minuta TaxID=111878 RepID=A0AAV7K8E1_9METZ|nr:G-protein-signaling modulator 1-like [Oopsacas minuta]